MSKKKKTNIQNQPISFSNYIIKNARKLELFKCWKSDTSNGMGHFVVARQRKNGTLVVGVYLVDLSCLGLKGTFYTEFEDLEDIQEKLLEAETEILNFEEIEPNLCFNYIYGAIEYAEDLGFQPHKDFKITEYILDDVEDIDFIDIDFGFNGKPLYVAGPDDNVNQILAILNKNVGEGNYEYIVPKHENDWENEEMENDDDEYSDNLFEELNDLRDLSDEELIERTEQSIFNYSDEVKPTYAIFLLIHMALLAWKKVDQYQTEYKKSPESCIEKAVKYLQSKLPEEIRQGHYLKSFATISIENTVKFEGSEFFLLTDFQTAFEAFQKEEIQENHVVISTFMIPFEFQRMQAIMGIRGYFSEELYQESEFENLNTFQKNRVADLFLETLEVYKLKGIVNQACADIEYILDDYLEISGFMPSLSSAELKKMVITMVLPEIDE